MKNTQKAIISKGFGLLQQKMNYPRSLIVSKIKGLGYKTSEPSLSNILKGKDAGRLALSETSEGMKKLVEMECCHQWDDHSAQYLHIPGCSPVKVPEWAGTPASGVVFYDKGRLSIDEKVRFFSTAQKEMVEFGLTLNTFTGYFFSRNKDEFRNPIHSLLEKGVHIKCYLLDPGSNEARLYFNDRAKYFAEEQDGIDKIKKSIARFKTILEEIEECKYKGKMEVFTYKHIPHQYILAIDRDKPEGKFQTSHYLFGELRAHCPVVECTRKANAPLFLLYNGSLEKLMNGAKKVQF